MAYHGCWQSHRVATASLPAHFSVMSRNGNNQWSSHFKNTDISKKTIQALARQRKREKREVERLWFCHTHPIAFLVWCSNSSSAVNPNARGATVLVWKSGYVWRQQRMGNEGVACL